jgi:hypothetical protein
MNCCLIPHLIKQINVYVKSTKIKKCRLISGSSRIMGRKSVGAGYEWEVEEQGISLY